MVTVMIFSSCASNFYSEANPYGGRTYYVDAEKGNDNADGLSPLRAWRSLRKVNSFPLEPGDGILFKRGSQWRGILIPQSGTAEQRILYGSYGSGELPRINGSIERSSMDDWKMAEDNLWILDETLPTDVGNIIFDDRTSFGIKKWTKEDLVNEHDFLYDKGQHTLFIKSRNNPAEFHDSVEIALNIHVVDFAYKSYIHFDSLHITKGGGHGFRGNDSSFITIENCEISYIGGGECPGLYRERYGNAIEFWGSNNNQLVENCHIYEIYDTGLTNQNNTTEEQQFSITYRNNLIERCAMYSFEIWNNTGRTSILKDIYFENNICLDSGKGWGIQRPHAVGFHLNFGWNFAGTFNIQINENIFDGGKFLLAEKFSHEVTGWWSDISMSGNQYHTTAEFMNKWPWLITYQGEARLGFNMNQLDRYIAYIGTDADAQIRVFNRESLHGTQF